MGREKRRQGKRAEYASAAELWNGRWVLYIVGRAAAKPVRFVVSPRCIDLNHGRQINARHLRWSPSSDSE